MTDNLTDFRIERDLMEVTSLRRPDVRWRFVDAQGHEHRWYLEGAPATYYAATCHYDTPTLIWVKDGEEYWEDDDEPHDVGHLECKQCGEPVKPGYTADDHKQYVPGLLRCYINGVSVSKEEYERRWLEAQRAQES